MMSSILVVDPEAVDGWMDGGNEMDVIENDVGGELATAAAFTIKEVRDLDFGIKVFGSEIVREHDGLAMSSRNVKLSPENRQKALSISRALSRAKVEAEKGQVNCRELINFAIQTIGEAGGRVDYAEIVEQESLEAVETIKRPVVFCVAAWFGKVRLVDNMEIDV